MGSLPPGKSLTGPAVVRSRGSEIDKVGRQGPNKAGDLGDFGRFLVKTANEVVTKKLAALAALAALPF